MSMIRTVTFGPDDVGKRRYTTLVSAFILGGNALLQKSQGQRSRDDRAKDAKVMRELKRIGDEQNDQLRLKPEGGALLFDQKQHEHVMKYCEAAPLPTQQSDDLDDLLDFLSAARSIDPATVPKTPE